LSTCIVCSHRDPLPCRLLLPWKLQRQGCMPGWQISGEHRRFVGIGVCGLCSWDLRHDDGIDILHLLRCRQIWPQPWCSVVGLVLELSGRQVLCNHKGSLTIRLHRLLTGNLPRHSGQRWCRRLRRLCRGKVLQLEWRNGDGLVSSLRSGKVLLHSISVVLYRM
jgi:hypothetical protein